MTDDGAPGSDRSTDPSGGAGSSGSGADVPDLVGRLVAGRYRVLELLGRGAMGAVYLAEHERMGRRDALKVLPRKLAADPDALARFTREARNACRIRHPNVCQVYDFGETDDGLPFLAMEYVEGETLGEVLEREGPLAPARVAELIDQITHGLEAAHARGIVHRDLKPDNIMLTRDLDGSEQVKVVDFGIAKAVEGGDEAQEVTRAGWVVGTPEYVSPEQLGGGSLDARSDVYSLGVVIFRTLTGELPFEGSSWREIMTRRLTERPRRLRDARPDLERLGPLQGVLDRVLAKEPDDRPPSAAALRTELREAVTASGTGEPDGGLAPTRAVSTAPAAEPAGDDPDGLAPTRAVGDGWEEETGEASAVGATSSAGARAGSESPAGASDPRRAGLLVAGAAVVFLAGLGGVGYALGWFGGTPTAGTSAAGTPPATAAVNGEPATSDGRDAGTPRPEAAGEEEAPPEGAGGGGDGGDAGPEDASPTSAEPSSAPSDDAAEPEPEESPPSPEPSAPTSTDGDGTVAEGGPVTTPERASNVLFRQLETLSLDEVTLPRIRGARDTAMAVWELPGATDPDRAMAAYVAATALQALDRDGEALPWAERAVELAPDNRGFRELRNLLRDGAP